MPVVLGIIMVVGGCGSLGILAFLRLENRVRLLSAFSLLCDRLACEIGFRLTPLPELPRRLPSLRKFWDSMKYEPYGEESFSDAWNRAALALDLPAIDRSLVCEIGEVLGRYDADNQARALGVIRQQLEVSLALARDNRQKYGRLYGLLGLLCGCLLVITLI